MIQWCHWGHMRLRGSVRGYLLETMVSLGSVSVIWGNCGKINLGSGFSPLNRYLVLGTSINKKLILKKKKRMLQYKWNFFKTMRTRFVWLTQAKGSIWHVIISLPMVTFQKSSRGCGYMFYRFTTWHWSLWPLSKRKYKPLISTLVFYIECFKAGELIMFFTAS